MSLITTVGGIDVSNLIKLSSIEITDELNQINTLKFKMSGTASDRPEIGEEVIMTYNGNRIFAGTIDDITEREYGGKLLWEIECVDYNQLCNRFLVIESYRDLTAGQIVRNIINNFMPNEGVTVNNVEDGPTVVEAIFNYETVAKALDRLSDKTGYVWYIDYNKDMHFHDRSTNSAPISITDENKYAYNFQVHKTREEFRNAQYIRAGKDKTDTRTEYFVGDGKRQTFTVKFPIAEEPIVKVNDQIKTVGIRGAETGYDWYWNEEEKEITQDDNGTPLTETDVLSVTYKGLFPIVVAAEKGQAIEERKAVEGGSGRYYDIQDMPNIKNSEAALEEANGLLAKYGTIPETVTFDTFEDGLRSGQLIYIKKSMHDIDGFYLISSVIGKPAGFNFGKLVFMYSITALSGTNVGGWIKFFKKMAQAGRIFVIRENEVLIKLKTFEEKLKISDSLTIEKGAPESRIGYAQIGFSEVA